MFPVPPRPVVTIGVLSVGVWRSSGWIWVVLELSIMLPAPPRPEDCMWEDMEDSLVVVVGRWVVRERGKVCGFEVGSVD